MKSGPTKTYIAYWSDGQVSGNVVVHSSEVGEMVLLQLRHQILDVYDEVKIESGRRPIIKNIMVL